MHPEIKKFWEQYGEVEVDEFYACQTKNGVKSILARKINDIWMYYYFSLFTEKEMLRVVELKAFL